MSKRFLTSNEQKTILSAYSKNFEKELTKYGPYTFGTEYAYRISICPEIDHKGKDTGRILVNHYSYSYGSLRRIPEFIDVWEREEKEIVFRTRNIPGKDLISSEERIKVLEEEIKALKDIDKVEIGKLHTKKLHDYAVKMTKTAEQFNNNYNEIVKRLHSYREESDIYFRENPTYFDLVKERDDALVDLEQEKSRRIELEEKLKETTEKYLEAMRKLNSQSSNPVHNARGAGRKKDSSIPVKAEKVRKMREEGYSPELIMKEMGIGRSTYFRYLKMSEKDYKNK